jgi:hypothetical protein
MLILKMILWIVNPSCIFWLRRTKTLNSPPQFGTLILSHSTLSSKLPSISNISKTELKSTGLPQEREVTDAGDASAVYHRFDDAETASACKFRQ